MQRRGPAHCALCGCDRLLLADTVHDYEYGSPGAHHYWRCVGCGLVQLFPQPSAAVLSSAYPSTYHAYQTPSNVLGRWLKHRYWRHKAIRYKSLLGGRGRILDVGCANGDFLSELRSAGLKDIVGIDFSPTAIRIARARGFEAYSGELETQDLAPASFDMIVMTNFIEHVSDPVKTLSLCAMLLRPGGFLVGETPNIECWDYRLFRRHWGGFHAPRHFFLFTPATLSMVALRTHLAVASITNMLQPAHWALSLQNLFVDMGFGLRVDGGRSRLYTAFQLVTAPVNVLQECVSSTTSVEFVFRKSD